MSTSSDLASPFRSSSRRDQPYTLYCITVKHKALPAVMTMLALLLFILPVLGHVASPLPTSTDPVFMNTTPGHDSHNTTIEPRAIPIRGDNWQYDMEECFWVRQFYPIVATSCTEYCVAGLKGDKARLKYHV